MNNKQFLQIYGIEAVKIAVFAFAIFLMTTTANAQTALEQQCYNDVQGKVAWNQAGNTSWGEGNLRNLCRGTTNPSATIACFQAQIKQHGEWSRGISACLPERTGVSLPNKIQEEKTAVQPAAIETVRTVTFKNNAHIQATLAVGAVSSGQINIGESKTVNIKESSGTTLQILVAMKLPNLTNFIIYSGTISGDNRATNFCFEAKGDVGKPSVAPCNGTQAVEAKKVEIRHEAGVVAKATLDYYVNGNAKSISTDQVSIGFNRVFYLPFEADKDKDITLNTYAFEIVGTQKLTGIRIDRNSGTALCYKIWGGTGTVKTSPCSLNPSARTIRLKSLGAFIARINVVYYDQFLQRQSVDGNKLSFLDSDVMEIPQGLAARPIEINFMFNQALGFKKFHTATVQPNFTGEVCFKTEGTIVSPNAATCDDELNATPGVDSRQIVFKNEAGYDAQIFVQYFELQDVSGTKIPMPKTVASGFINLGKSRTITIPKATAPNMPIIAPAPLRSSGAAPFSHAPV